MDILQILKKRNCIYLSSLCHPLFSFWWLVYFVLSIYSYNFSYYFLLLEIISCNLSSLIGLLCLFYYLIFRSFSFLCNFSLFFLSPEVIWYSHIDFLLHFLFVLLTRQVHCYAINKVTYFDWHLYCTILPLDHVPKRCCFIFSDFIEVFFVYKFSDIVLFKIFRNCTPIFTNRGK